MKQRQLLRAKRSLERLAARQKLSPTKQLEILATRPGSSERETRRLKILAAEVPVAPVVVKKTVKAKAAKS